MIMIVRLEEFLNQNKAKDIVSNKEIDGISIILYTKKANVDII